MAYTAKDRPSKVRAPAQQPVEESKARCLGDDPQPRRPVPKPRRRSSRKNQESDEVASPASGSDYSHAAYVRPGARTRTPQPRQQPRLRDDREELKPYNAAAGNVRVDLDLHVDAVKEVTLALSLGLDRLPPNYDSEAENSLKYFSSYWGPEFETCSASTSARVWLEEEDDEPQVCRLPVQETRPDATSELVPGVLKLNYRPAV